MWCLGSGIVLANLFGVLVLAFSWTQIFQVGLFDTCSIP